MNADAFASNAVHVRHWLHKTREWLAKVEKDPKILPGIGILLDKMQAAHASGDLDDRWSLERRLNLMMENLQTPEERARIHFRWGLLEALNGDDNRALDKLRKAREGYLNQSLPLGLLLLATGLVEWLLPESHTDAPVTLNRGERSLHDSIGNYKSGIKDDPDWIRKRHADADNLLRAMLTENRILPCPYPLELDTRPAGEKAPPQPGDLPDGLLAWQIFDTVNAGSPGAVGFDLTPIGEVRINQFLIDDRPYSLHSLVRGAAQRVLPATDQMLVVRVRGDSMDKSGILEGDYVLLRKSSRAENGEIVVAQIQESPDSFATLKRCHLESDGSLELRPESSNPQHKPHTYPPGSPEIQIIGTAQFVLKPLK